MENHDLKSIESAILEELKGKNIDDAFEDIDKLSRMCKEIILEHSIVSFAWDRHKEEE